MLVLVQNKYKNNYDCRDGTIVSISPHSVFYQARNSISGIIRTLGTLNPWKYIDKLDGHTVTVRVFVISHFNDHSSYYYDRP